MHRRFPALGSVVKRTLIVAYKEDTTQLEDFLRSQGFTPEVLRPSYTETELGYSRAIRCLLNHTRAWELAASTEGHTLIMEADFVPCRDLRSLPCPFDPA